MRRNRRILLYLTLAASLPLACPVETTWSQVEGPVTISNELIRLTVNPSVGRIVDFGFANGPNLMRITDPSVLTEGKKHYVYVPAGGGRVRSQEVKIGRASEAYVEITEGLDEGGRILIRAPRPGEVIKK